MEKWKEQSIRRFLPYGWLFLAARCSRWGSLSLVHSSVPVDYLLER